MKKFQEERTTVYNEKDLTSKNSNYPTSTKPGANLNDVHTEELPTYNNEKLKDTNSILSDDVK